MMNSPGLEVGVGISAGNGLLPLSRVRVPDVDNTAPCAVRFLAPECHALTHRGAGEPVRTQHRDSVGPYRVTHVSVASNDCLIRLPVDAEPGQLQAVSNESSDGLLTDHGRCSRGKNDGVVSPIRNDLLHVARGYD